MSVILNYNSQDYFGGYRPDPEGTDAFCNLLAKIGNGHNPDGKAVADRVFDDEKKEVILAFPLVQGFPNWKSGSQGLGDCMSWSCAHAVDTLATVQAYILKMPEDVLYQVSSEVMYGFMRVEVFGRPDYGGDGAYGGAAAKAVMKFGTLHRKKYEFGQGYDFTTYSGSRARTFGRTGVPDELEPLAREHLVKTATMVTDFETAAKFIMNGYPISNAHGSNPTLTGSRDRDGFGRGRGYAHAMNYIGVRWGSRPGLLKTNTGWAQTTSGPMYPDNLPKSLLNCCWWEEADLVNYTLRGQDSFAYSQYQGFKKQDLKDFGSSSYL